MNTKPITSYPNTKPQFDKVHLFSQN